MSLFKNKNKNKKEENPSPSPSDKKPDDNTKPDNPMLIVSLVDGVHLDIAIAWPDDCDIRKFAQVLALLNTGNLVAPQLAAASVFASHANQPEQAIEITRALDGVKKTKSGTSESGDEPLILPSKFTHNLMKSYGN